VSFLESRTRSAREGFGKPVLRVDDARLLVGAGCYSDDVNLPGQAYACFVRSPHAHARIRRVDTAGALATPGVIAVLTGEDAAADGVKSLTHSPMPGNPHEEMVKSHHVSFVAPHPPMPADRVRFAGEVVASGHRRDVRGGARWRRACGRRLDAAARRHGKHQPPPLPTRRSSMRALPRTCAWIARSATPRRWTWRSHVPPTWCGSTRGCSVSPA
jgi:hypothetical protein